MTLEALRGNLDVTLGTCAHRGDTNEVALGITLLAVGGRVEARLALPITWGAPIVQGVELTSSQASGA